MTVELGSWSKKKSSLVHNYVTTVKFLLVRTRSTLGKSTLLQNYQTNIASFETLSLSFCHCKLKTIKKDKLRMMIYKGKLQSTDLTIHSQHLSVQRLQ